MLLSSALLAALATSQEFDVPDGFSVFVAAGARHSYLSLTIDARGRVLLGTEAAGVLVAEDADGDGLLETLRPFAALDGVQGLCVVLDPPALLAVGRHAGQQGLWSLPLDGAGDPLPERLELRHAIEGDDEHGAHGVVLGPDGAAYVTFGDQARFVDPPLALADCARERADQLLPPLPEPSGFGARRTWPYGHVARVTAEGWTHHSVGYRNAYDLAFRADGELFTVDSDMEWDAGLPWYRPVRALLCVPGGDYGARPGSGPLPDWYPDTLPAVCELGRGSPTGVVLYEHDAFPPEWRGALLVGDWTAAAIRAVVLTPNGGGFRGEERPLLAARGALPVTDLEVAPDGSVLFVTGGRGAEGAVYRLRHAAGPAPRPDDPLERALTQPQPTSAWARATLHADLAATGLTDDALRAALVGALEDAARPVVERLAALRALTARGLRPATLFQDAELAAMPPAVAAAVYAGEPTERRQRRSALAAGGDARLSRRAFEQRPLATRDAAVVLSMTRDRWLLYARRPFVPDLLRGVAPTGDVMHKNHTWFEHRLREPKLLHAQDCHDMISFLWIDVEPEERLRQLRVVQLVLAAGARVDERFGPNLDHRLGQLTAHEDARIRHDAALLLAFRAPRTAPAILLDALDAADERAEAIHFARCLVPLAARLDDEQRARYLAFFEEAAEWTGGGSFAAYLQGMLDAAVDALPAARAAELAARDALGPRALATCVARKSAADAAALVAPLQRAFAALGGGDEPPALVLERRRALLGALGGVRLPALAPWLRGVGEEEPQLVGEALVLLAELDLPEDWELLVAGLESGRFDVREACIAALARAPRKARDAATIRRVLDQVRLRGPRGGHRLLRVLSAWTGRAPGAPDKELWVGELAEWERWFGATYPDFEAPPPSPRDGVRWTFEDVLGFLERTAGRPGSAARGARVYHAAACHTCHTIGTGDARVGSGWGPDLTQVAHRLDPRALLEALADPSRNVAARFANTRVVTVQGAWLEGRIVREDGAALTLLGANGVETVVARRDAASVALSDVSPMPEGLLDELTLEEVKDLVAYLMAGGAADPAEFAEPAWVDLLADAQRSHWGGTRAGWRLANGVLEGSADDLPASTYLVYDVPYGDFELEFDVCAPDANSGVQYRSAIVAGKADPVGYQADVGKAWWGALFATDERAAAIAMPERLALKDAVNWQGWNHYHVRVAGDRHVIELNGYPMVDARDGAHTEGLFALQLHQKMQMQVWFTNLRVRRL